MRLIFVRHGDANYERDCLTELGHAQAEAAAVRLLDEKIDRIFSSTCGRAIETARHIAEKQKLDIEESYDFMREISWGSISGEPIYEKGHPWFTVQAMVLRGESVVSPDWASKHPFDNNRVIYNTQKVAEGIDGWLAGLGYERDGLYYRVTKRNDENIIMTSHGGSSSAAMAHLLNLPFTFFCSAVIIHNTSICIVRFDGDEGKLITPKIELLSDARHIRDIKKNTNFC